VTGNVDIGHFFFYQDPVTRRLITKALIASWNEDLQKYAIESVRNFSYPLSQRLKKSFISGEFVVNYTSVNGARTLFPFPALQECPLSKNKFSSQLKRAHETGSRYSVALIRKSEGEAFWVDGATWKKQIASPINPSTNEAVQEEAINLKSVIGYEWFACEPGSNEFVAVPAPIGQQWKIIEPDMECCPLTKSNIADLALKALDKNQLLYSVVKEGKTICDAEAWFKRHKACCIEHQHSDIEVYYRSSFDPLYSRINKLFNAAFLKVYSEYVQNPARFELKDLVTLFQQNSSYASISQFAKDFNDPNKDFKGFLELVENATELQLVAYDTESRKSGSTANYNHMFEELNIADRAYLESFSATEL
jgi:hypothetical protein